MKRAPRSAFFKAWKCQFFRLKSRNAFSHILQEDFIQLKNKGTAEPAAIILRYFSFFRPMFINPNNSIENGNAPWRIEKDLISNYTCFEAFKCTVIQKKTNDIATIFCTVAVIHSAPGNDCFQFFITKCHRVRRSGSYPFVWQLRFQKHGMVKLKGYK